MHLTPDTMLQRLKLLPYQSAFAANPSRFKIGLWARQTGKDHTAAAEAVIDCLHHPGTTWIILAAGERQALESLAKAKDWAAILDFPIDAFVEPPANIPLTKARSTSTEIRWSNGSRLIALPANPQTVRGYCANLILTEFAFHENADAIWRAIYPSISNPLRGGLKKLRIISTPNGLNNKFAQLWHADQSEGPHLRQSGADSFPVPDWIPSSRSSEVNHSSNSTFDLRHSELPSPRTSPFSPSLYHKSKISIHDAINHGLSINASELRAGLDDEDAWCQEYLCEFMDTSTVLFPYDLIAPCESEQALETNPQLSTINPQPLLYAGIDFGRKHHLTVCWILERLPAPPGIHSNFDSRTSHLYVTREVLCLKNTPTPEQLEILRPRLQRCRKICLDYTGAGIGLGDSLMHEFGEYHPNPLLTASSGARPARTGKVDLCSFTPALKAELFPRLRAAFEQRLLRIPISRDIREDLHAIQRTVTHNGQINYRAPHTPDGHSDRTTALALALRAATSAPLSGCSISISVPGRTADLRWARHLPRLSRLPRRGFWL